MPRKWKSREPGESRRWPAGERHRTPARILISVLMVALLSPAILLMPGAPASAEPAQLWITATSFGGFAPSWNDPGTSGELIVEERSGSNKLGQQVLALVPGERLLVSLEEKQRSADWIQNHDEFSVCVIADTVGTAPTRIEIAPTDRSIKQVFDLTDSDNTYARYCTLVASHSNGDQKPIRVTVRHGGAEVRVRSIVLEAAQPRAYEAADYAEYHFLGIMFADTMRCAGELDPTTCIRDRSTFSLGNSWTRDAGRSDVVNEFYFDAKAGVIDRFHEVALTLGSVGDVTRSDNVTVDASGAPQKAVRTVELRNYAYRYEHSVLPPLVNELLQPVAGLDEDERLLRLRAFAMSYIEGEGSRGGAVGDDPHRVHLDEVAKVMTALGVATEITGSSFVKLRVADAEGMATVASWPFGGYHRTPGCDTDGVRCPARS